MKFMIPSVPCKRNLFCISVFSNIRFYASISASIQTLNAGDLVVVRDPDHLKADTPNSRRYHPFLIFETPEHTSRFKTFFGLNHKGSIRFFTPSMVYLCMPSTALNSEISSLPPLPPLLPSWLSHLDQSALDSKGFSLNSFRFLQYHHQLSSDLPSPDPSTAATMLWEQCQRLCKQDISLYDAADMIQKHFVSSTPLHIPTFSLLYTALNGLTDTTSFDPQIPYTPLNPIFSVVDPVTRSYRRRILKPARLDEFAQLCSRTICQSNDKWSPEDEHLLHLLHQTHTQQLSPPPSFSSVFANHLRVRLPQGLVRSRSGSAIAELLTKLRVYSPSENLPLLRRMNVHPWMNSFPSNKESILYSNAFEIESDKIVNRNAPDLKKTSNSSESPEIQEFMTKLKAHWKSRFGLQCKEDESQKTNTILLKRRRDFGNLPVFVIDDEGAHELDDGISIEDSLPSDAEDGDSPWFHIHIADPSAYISPHSPWTMLAQLRSTSVYLCERHHPMIPSNVPKKLMNLGTSRFAMTFSFRLNRHGLVKDWDVNPSIINNIIVVSYNQVDRLLDWSNVYDDSKPLSAHELWVQHKLKEFSDISRQEPSEKIKYVLTEHGSQLKALQKWTHLLRQERVMKGWSEFDKPDVAIKLDPYPIPLMSELKPANVSPDKNPPTITLQAGTGTRLSPARDMIAQLMVMAGRVAARYCYDRDIPVPYRTQSKPEDADSPQDDIKHRLQSLQDKRDRESGVIPYSAVDWRGLFQPAQYSILPSGHYGLRFDGFVDSKPTADSPLEAYVQVTSPLRRFLDMLVHWQLKAYWLHELTQKESKEIIQFPFTPEQVEKIAQYQHDIEKKANVAENASNEYWALEFANRKEWSILHHSELKLKPNAKARDFITSSPSRFNQPPKSLLDAKVMPPLPKTHFGLQDSTKFLSFRSLLSPRLRRDPTMWKIVRATQKVYRCRVIGRWVFDDYTNRNNPEYTSRGDLKKDGLCLPRPTPRTDALKSSNAFKESLYPDGLPVRAKLSVVVEELGHFLTVCEAYDFRQIPEVNSIIDAVFTRIEPGSKYSLMMQCPPPDAFRIRKARP